MSQKEQNRTWLKEKKHITSIEAIKLCGCTRLAARIADLRKDGCKISSYLVTENGRTFARYFLDADKEDVA